MCLAATGKPPNRFRPTVYTTMHYSLCVSEIHLLHTLSHEVIAVNGKLSRNFQIQGSLVRVFAVDCAESPIMSQLAHVEPTMSSYSASGKPIPEYTQIYIASRIRFHFLVHERILHEHSFQHHRYRYRAPCMACEVLSLKDGQSHPQCFRCLLRPPTLLLERVSPHCFSGVVPNLPATSATQRTDHDITNSYASTLIRSRYRTKIVQSRQSYSSASPTCAHLRSWGQERALSQF